MSSDTEKAIEEILEDFEKQPLQDRRTFRSLLNQPELINLSSANAQIQSPPISPLTFAQYYNFTINLPRPALNAKSLQLLKAVIPQAQCSIPDYSLVFPYYKLRTVPIDDTGQVAYIDYPSYSTLKFVRLLPSYYKPELFFPQYTQGNYGLNKTFNDYRELLEQVKIACKSDIYFTARDGFIANEITFIYDEDINKFLFRGLNTDTPPEINEYPEWDPTVTYVINDIVFYGINFYKSKVNGNTDFLPNTSPTKWTNITYQINGYSSWSYNFAYNINEVVQYSGIFYRCIQPVDIYDENPPPTSPSRWQDVSQYFEISPEFNAYLIAGYKDKHVQTLLQFIELQSTEWDLQRIRSVPGNKYVEGQTLARRMGFTWDSTGMIYDSSINNYYENGIDFGGTTPLFYNRIRVVPTYYPTVASPLVGGSILGSIDSYTADGYCNLVYSSIINIYTTIVGTSSVDTQRNANLLAMIEMNCGNLGVAMVGNYIDTKLTKIQSDIYSIYIELRDENSQPYYLTNNATTTLLLKLSYD